LGELTISMLRGEAGHQRKEVLRLTDWITEHFRPDVVNLSNILIAGCIPALKERVAAPVLVTLQGDDLFLEDLKEPYKTQALAEIRRLIPHIDGFITHTNFYRDFMSEYLGFPIEQCHVVPLGLKVDDFPLAPADRPMGPKTIGYMARICPAKGFHLLVDAFCILKEDLFLPDIRLHAAGWLGDQDQVYFADQLDKLKAAGCEASFTYAGVVDRRQKIEFLRGLDVLSVPAAYHEPKGLYVLEALAAGIPVVEPEHGAFPELIARTGGGRLVPPNDARALAATLRDVLFSEEGLTLARLGQQTVHASYNALKMAAETRDVYSRYIRPRS
jgi:glycosyltransferase involved in cell wall biosynthesis